MEIRITQVNQNFCRKNVSQIQLFKSVMMKTTRLFQNIFCAFSSETEGFALVFPDVQECTPVYESFRNMQVSILFLESSNFYFLLFQQSNGMVINKFGATFQQLVNLLRSETLPPLVRILKTLRESLTSDEKVKYFGAEENVTVIPEIKEEEPDIVDLAFDEDVK